MQQTSSLSSEASFLALIPIFHLRNHGFVVVTLVAHAPLVAHTITRSGLFTNPWLRTWSSQPGGSPPRRGGGPLSRPLHQIQTPDGATYVLYNIDTLDRTGKSQNHFARNHLQALFRDPLQGRKLNFANIVKHDPGRARQRS